MKALILVASHVEDMELFYPYYRLREEGWDVDVATPDGQTIVGEHGYGFDPDMKISETDGEGYDLLVLPGGKAPERVRMAPESVEIARSMLEAGKTVAAICHGIQTLISADVLKGRKVTCWPAIRDDAKAAGAEYVDQEVVVDGNLVTSRRPDDLPAFCREMLAAARQAV